MNEEIQMKMTRYSEPQIRAILHQAEVVCRRLIGFDLPPGRPSFITNVWLVVL